jgi:hypothetical protein
MRSGCSDRHGSIECGNFSTTMRSVHPTCHNTKNLPTLEGEPFAMLAPHAKQRREGYRKG